MNDEQITEIFQSYDENGDGKITLQGLRSLFNNIFYWY